jgi:hypothetical protein
MKPDERAFLIAVAGRTRVTYREWLERQIRTSHPVIADGYRNQLISPYYDLDKMVPEETIWDVGIRLGIHPKRIGYLCLKWAGRDWLDYGTSPGMGWLTDAGKARAAELAQSSGGRSRHVSARAGIGARRVAPASQASNNSAKSRGRWSTTRETSSP